MLRDVTVTCPSDDWGAYAMYLEGLFSTGGLRVFYLDNVQLFGAKQGCLYIAAMRYSTIVGLQLNQAGGALGGFVIEGSASETSQSLNISGTTTGGTVGLAHCNNITLNFTSYDVNVNNVNGTAVILIGQVQGTKSGTFLAALGN